jgi:hypothetical protein
VVVKAPVSFFLVLQVFGRHLGCSIVSEKVLLEPITPYSKGSLRAVGEVEGRAVTDGV